MVHLVLQLHDLLKKADDASARVSHKEHLPAIDGIEDLTDLIRECRAAVCHIQSSLPKPPDQDAIAFYVASGYVPPDSVAHGMTRHCEFDDDIAIYWGALRLYVNRNARVALELGRVALGR